jgi:hypothetical protein
VAARGTEIGRGSGDRGIAVPACEDGPRSTGEMREVTIE